MEPEHQRITFNLSWTQQKVAIVVAYIIVKYYKCFYDVC